jgi:hypothetical protein
MNVLSDFLIRVKEYAEQSQSEAKEPFKVVETPAKKEVAAKKKSSAKKKADK